ncbi:hypothetical protein BDR22DRAFT_891869 [Usnea florida]
MLSNLPRTPSASDDEFVDVTAAIFQEVNVPPSEDPEPFVKSRLRDEAEKVIVGETENKIVYANTGAYRIFEHLDEMTRKVNILIAKDGTKTSNIEELRQKVSYLESRRDERTDLRTYRELYGLCYQQVLDYSSKVDDEGLLLVLNAHGTMVAQGKSISNDLKDSFNCFIGQVEEFWLQRPTEHPNSPLSSAYHLFWKKFNEAKV